jgi:hypothetical protein
MAKLSFMNVIFEYKASDLTQYYRIQYFDRNNKVIKNPEIPYGLKKSGIISENEFWPKDWETEGRTHKASVFSPKNNEFCYYYNINDMSYYMTNSLSKNHWTHSWKYSIKNLPDNGQVITAFWWIKTEEIYYLLEPRGEKFRIGKIYYHTKSKHSRNDLLLFPVST